MKRGDEERPAHRSGADDQPGGASLRAERLERRGLLRREGGRLRTTRRWQAAMMRAATRLLARGEGGGDLRPAIASALVELLGDEVDDVELAELVLVMLPIERAELGGPFAREA